MNDQIRPQPGIMEIDLYVGGQSQVPGHSEPIKLSSNENPAGPSDKAKEAFSRAVHRLNRYPSTDHATLHHAIGEVHGLDPDRILCGAGSDEIISFLCQAYAGPGTEVLFTEHGFLMYRISAHAAGATPVQVRERDRVTDIDALIAGATERTRLIFVANPANLDPERGRRFLHAVERGAQYMVNHPDEAWQIFSATAPDLQDELNSQAWKDTLPRFAQSPAALDQGRYARFEEFLLKAGLIDKIRPVSDIAIDLGAQP